jgi:AraC-like DNA-binding protein
MANGLQGIGLQGIGGQRIKAWRTPGFDGLLFYQGVRVVHAYPRHWHEELHICSYGPSAGRLGILGSSHRIVENDFVITPAGTVHENSVESELGCTFRSLYIDIKLLQRLTHQIIGRSVAAPDFKDVVVNDALTQQRFLEMHHAMQQPASQLEREELLLEFVRCLVTRCSSQRPVELGAGDERLAVRRIRHFIDEHFAGPITLSDLAGVANLSPFHLHHVFRKQTGLPPHAYQTQVRINQAKQLMLKRLPLSHVAAAVGFADQSHFTRHFRRLVGLTPGQFAC